MKRTLFLLAVLAPVATLIGLLWDSGWGTFGGGPGVAQRAAKGGTSSPATSRPSIISFTDGSGSDLFIQRDGTTTISGQSDPVTFPRSFSFARSWSNGGPGLIVAEQPVVLFNATPRNEHDVSRLIRIETANGSAAAGRALAAAFGSASGIRSNRARISGNSDLSRLTRVEFSGKVEAVFLDAEVEGDRVTLATESLTLDFVENAVASIRTDDPFTITRPSAGDFMMTGRGLEVLLQKNHATVFHDVRIEAILPERVGTSRVPIVATAPGPVELTMSKGKKPGSTLPSLAGSHLFAGGGVAFEQGDLRGSGRQVTATWDEAARVSTVELTDDVRITGAQGTLEGSRLVLTPRDEAVLVRIEGRPVTARLDQHAGFVPAQLGRDVTLTTPGVVTISPLHDRKDGSTKERTIDVGPEVLIAGTDGRISAARIITTIGLPDQRGERAFRVDLAKVDAHDQETDVLAERMTIVRDARAAAIDDVITFPAAYAITRRPKPKPGAPPEPETPPSRPTSRRDVPSIGDGPITLRAGGGLEITRPVLDERPIVAVASEKFVVEAIDPKTNRPSGTLEAKRGRLVVERSGPAATPGGVPTQQVGRFDADGRVRLELPGRGLALGEKLTYDARLRQITLVGSGEKDVARIERTSPKGRDRLAAGTITFQQDLYRLVATQGVVAELLVAPLPWIGMPKSADPIPTTMFAQRLVASFDSEKFHAGQMVATDVMAEFAVKVVQPGRVLMADNARFDPTHRTGIFRGSPLRYDVVRVVDGESLPEGLVCPMVVMDEGDRTLIEGPATAFLHSKPGMTSPFAETKDKPKKPAGSQDKATPDPLELRCSGPALLTRDYIQADRRVFLEQRPPDAKPTTGSADSVTLFLEKDPAAPKGDPDFALAVMHGNARLTSPEFEGASDVMKINRVTKHMVLTNEHPEKISVILQRQVYGSSVRNGAAKLDIDFSKPGEPTVEADNFDLDTVIEEHPRPETRPKTPTRSKPR